MLFFRPCCCAGEKYYKFLKLSTAPWSTRRARYIVWATWKNHLIPGNVMLDNPSSATLTRPIVLGTVQLGRKYGIANRTGMPSEAAALDILTAAAKAGVEIFDTSPNYGESEKILGSFLDSWSGPEPWMITKITSGASQGISSERDLYSLFKKSLLTSLKDMRCKRPPGLIMQNAADAVENPAIIDCLLKLKQEGLAGEVGLAVYQEADLEFFLNQDGLCLVQAPFNIFDRRLAGYLADLKERGSTVWARSVFLQGLFFLAPNKLPQAVSSAAPYLNSLGQLSQEMGLGIERLAFLYARDTPGLDGLVVGVETMAQLQRNLELLKLPALKQEQRRKIERELTAVPEKVYNPILWKIWR